MLLQLFVLFFIIGTVSFGGGYAMLPVIEREVTSKGWITTADFTETVALAGMTPGSIASNSATIVGYKVAGLPGAIISSIAMSLPSLILILVIVLFFYKLHTNKLVKSAFYGLRPIVTSLIIYAAIQFAISNGVISTTISWDMISLLLIFGISLTSLLYFRVHPFIVILGAGVVGTLIH
ncbi:MULTISPECIES: chromate transporter [Metabacillus]|uniref:Chromate transporter n=2 Tax=Metabacillus TaxID=2675233 RepID=A0A179T5C6_9BACI|nr:MULTISPECIES: chromate transporter [Metabacillus]OAS89165.1 chromate transporter [Metabacillus litoralis]QNF28681.1 chromate transporter [Metabacillus sp. KUDC1714]